MKKKPHEILEENTILPIAEQEGISWEEAQRKFYGELIGPMYRDLVAKSADYEGLKPEYQELLKTALKDGRQWRLFLKGVNKDYILSFVYMLWCLYGNGHKVFELDSDLADALYHTDVTINSANIHFPFKSFVVYIRDSRIPFYAKTNSDGYDRESPLIAQNFVVDYVMVDLVKFSGMTSMRFVLGWHDVGSNTEDLKSWNNTTMFDCELIGEGKFRVKDDLAHNFPKDKVFSDEDRKLTGEASEGMVNFLFSFALYVTMHPEDVEVHKPAKFNITTHKRKLAIRQERAAAEESRYKVHYIGKKYAGLFRQARTYASGHGIELNHRVLVRGHWRDQWFGKRIEEEGRKVRGQHQKTIWLEPFYKGADLEQFSKIDVYKVT